MAKALTVAEFFARYPDDETCLNHLFATRYGDDPACPKCGQTGTLHKLSKLPAWTCNCGHHVHPMQGTPFERTRTPLQKWFYAMYLFTTTRNGVAAKELQRQLGVTYKTAWRIGHEIRKYMASVDGDFPLNGHVEADEAYIGGVKKGAGPGGAIRHKTAVFAMVERGGDVVTEIVGRVDRRNIIPLIERFVRRGATITTDESSIYRLLTYNGYRHGSVHHAAKEYVRGAHHTNTVEDFWSIVKRTIRGTHIHVSPKHLDKYLHEIEFRFNLRRHPELMFPRLMAGFAGVASWPVPITPFALTTASDRV